MQFVQHVKVGSFKIKRKLRIATPPMQVSLEEKGKAISPSLQFDERSTLEKKQELLDPLS